MSKVEPSFIHYLQSLGPDQPIETVLVGHLVIESLLVEILQLAIPKGNQVRLDKINFPQKLEFMASYSLLRQDRLYAYDTLNQLRNRFAHRLGHSIDHDFMYGYARKLASLGYDFSDTTLHSDRTQSKAAYSATDVLIEILNELYFELTEILVTLGGPDRRSG